MFADFGRLGLADFVATNSDPEALWLFIHIPKTAGSSFSTELNRARKPYRNIHIDYQTDEPYAVQIERAVESFIEDARANPVRSASGHIRLHHARAIQAAIPNVRLVTLLREPVARLVSDFKYQRTPAHPPYKAFIEQFPTFESYVEDLQSQNVISKHLGRETLPQLLDEMSFIGALELYPFSFNTIFKLMGSDALPRLHERPTPDADDNRVELTRPLVDRIRHLNAPDFEIYEGVRAMLRARRDEWRSSRAADQRAAPAS